MPATKGQFVWHELMTTDVEGAKAFYSELIGWKVNAMEGPMDYWTFSVEDRPICGLMLLPEQAKDGGAPPHWYGYVEVPQIDAAMKLAGDNGATVLFPVQDIPNVGKFCIIRDPQGAVIAPFQSTNDESPNPDKGPGEITWNELNTTDWEAAAAFYGKLFGWKKFDTFDMGPEFGIYWMYTYEGGDKALGGMSSAAKTQGFPPHWLHYINVADLDAAVKRVESSGGKLLNGPMEVPGGDKIAQCADPQGAAFALHWTK